MTCSRLSAISVRPADLVGVSAGASSTAAGRDSTGGVSIAGAAYGLKTPATERGAVLLYTGVGGANVFTGAGWNGVTIGAGGKGVGWDGVAIGAGWKGVGWYGVAIETGVNVVGMGAGWNVAAIGAAARGPVPNCPEGGV